MFWGAVLDLQQNWEGGKEISHLAKSAHMQSLPHYQHHSPDGTFFTNDEPTLSYHYPSMSVVYNRVQSWCCTFYGFGQTCNDKYSSL